MYDTFTHTSTGNSPTPSLTHSLSPARTLSTQNSLLDDDNMLPPLTDFGDSLMMDQDNDMDVPNFFLPTTKTRAREELASPTKGKRKKRKTSSNTSNSEEEEEETPSDASLTDVDSSMTMDEDDSQRSSSTITNLARHPTRQIKPAPNRTLFPIGRTRSLRPTQSM